MKHTDLTGYAALFGESLTSKVDLLGRLLGDSHYPSLGQYKERLLADAIRDFLPRTVEVGTGFVMFPHASIGQADESQYHDPLNHSAFSISRQCDILIYDVAKYPAVFRDRDFVVVRPEAVRAVIEVKGSLSRRDVLDALTSFYDFGVKWRTTQLFYREQYVPLTPRPSLIVMAWSIPTDATGRLRITPAAVCRMISKFYAKNVNLDEIDGYPFLQQFLIHNEARLLPRRKWKRRRRVTLIIMDGRHGMAILFARRMVSLSATTTAQLQCCWLHCISQWRKRISIDSSLTRLRLRISASFLTNTRPARGHGQTSMLMWLDG